jgi:hypothetical protein
MKVVIDIPKDFTGDYIADKFKDFFSRVIADIVKMIFTEQYTQKHHLKTDGWKEVITVDRRKYGR